jgi:hypothetical protein
MKKLLLALSLLAVVGTATAHEGFRGYRGGYYHGGCYGCGWVAPALIGGVIGYELSRPNTVYVEPQPSVVYVQPQPTVQAPPPGYHWQQMIDPQTNTQKIVLVPN